MWLFSEQECKYINHYVVVSSCIVVFCDIFFVNVNVHESFLFIILGGGQMIG